MTAAFMRTGSDPLVQLAVITLGGMVLAGLAVLLLVWLGEARRWRKDGAR